jgi:hypothetical protein
MKRLPMALLTLCLVVTLPACDKKGQRAERPPLPTGGDPPPNPTDSPTTASKADAWVQGQIKKALARHGKFSGDEWRTVYWSQTADEKGNSVESERTLVVKGIKFKSAADVEREMEQGNVVAVLDGFFLRSELTAADKLNGALWGAQAFLTADAHRFGDVRGQSLGRWTDGAGPLYWLRSYCAQRYKSGSVSWGFILPLGPDNPTGYAYLYDDQSDLFDSVFQYCQHPDTTAEQRRTIRSIRQVLRQDATKHAELGGRTKEPKEVRDTYVPFMETIDTSACPPDFQTAYQEHSGQGGDRLHV